MPFIDEDFVAVRKNKHDSKPTLTLPFGEEVEIVGTDGNFTEVRVPRRWDGAFTGFIKGADLPLREEGVLTLSVLDVQQGDGLILETPGGKITCEDLVTR